MKSDLDLTFWFDEELPDYEARCKMSDLLRGTRRVFPALGETNAYSRHITEALRPWMNRYEAARDPVLCQHLWPSGDPGGGRVSERAQKSVFLLRMLEADFHNLIRDPSKRTRKWREHFVSVGVGDPAGLAGPRAVDAILTAALFWVEPNLAAAVSAALEVYLRGRFEQGRRDYEIQLNEILVCGFTHRFCFLDEALPRTKGALVEIALAQLAWEVSAMSGRFLLIEKSGDIADHLRRVALTAEQAARLNPNWSADFADLAGAAEGLRETVIRG